jgi:hypothetical protein
LTPSTNPRVVQRRRTRPRARSEGFKKLKHIVAAEPVLVDDPELEPSPQRPRTRGDCAGGARPCPWLSCRHHLYLDVNPETGSIKLNFPDLEPGELASSCSLDIADDGDHVLDDVGAVMNLTRERTRQVEMGALARLKPHLIP